MEFLKLITKRYSVTDCLVTIQQIGDSSKENVIQLLKEGVDLLPITIHEVPTLHHLYKKGSVIDLENPELPTGWNLSIHLNLEKMLLHKF